MYPTPTGWGGNASRQTRERRAESWVTNRTCHASCSLQVLPGLLVITSLIAAAGCGVAVYVLATAGEKPFVVEPDKPVAERVKDLMGWMTTARKKLAKFPENASGYSADWRAGL